MSLIKKKVCIIGNYGVGKTSLIKRFVQGIFSEKYLATVGVKIDQKAVRVGSKEVFLILWDIAGGIDESRQVPSYLQGLSAYIVVGDGTRAETCRLAPDLAHYVEDKVGEQPHILLLNKSDLGGQWALHPEEELKLASLAGMMLKTSAKTGDAVERAFQSIAEAMLGGAVHGSNS